MYYPTGSTHSIIPAAPNWYVAWPWLGDGTSGVTLDPIIAWLLVHSVTDYDRRVRDQFREEKLCHVDCYPVTADGVVSDIGENSALKDPSGQFIQPDECIHENETKFLAEWERKAKTAKKIGEK
jgi:hypothetical protein